MDRSSRSIFLVLSLLLVMMLFVSGCGNDNEKVTESAQAVSVTEVQKMDLVQNVSYPGIVRGHNEVTIMAKVPARVTDVYVKPGDHVSAGQVLLSLDSTDYQASVQQAAAAVSVASVGLNTARSNYERNKALYEAGAVSAAVWESAQRGLESAQAGVQQAQAAYQMVQNQIGNCAITSPINGVVGSINLSLGETASLAAPAAVVSDSSDLEVEVMVNENDVTYIKEGSEVDVVVKAAGLNKIKGKVDSIATVADSVKRNFAVIVSLPNQGDKIRSGMFAELSIDTISKTNVLCLPINAVIPQSGSSVVYTIDKNNKARPIDVQTGIKNDRYVEITKGLKAGQKVILKGNTLVNDGSLVRVIAGGGK